MTDILVLDESTVTRLLKQSELLDALRHGLRELSAGRTSVPPRLAAFTDAGLLATMPGYVEGMGLGVKLVSVFDGNESQGLPSHQAVILLFDPRTGSQIAMMDGTHITAVRTAGSAAVAALALARSDSRSLAILGSGVQARMHLDVFTASFNLSEVRIAARNSERARSIADGRSDVQAFSTFEEAVRGADIVCCCTNAFDPVIRQEWIAEGAHVSSVGRGAELDRATVAAATVFVEWRGAVINAPPAGAAELQGLDPDSVTEVGQVLSGSAPGRTSATQLTVYKSTGHAVEDVVAATLVYEKAWREGVGTVITL